MEQHVANPYSPSTTASTMSRTPVVRQISRVAALPQLAAIAGAMAIGVYLTNKSNGVFFGCAAYLAYSVGSRMLMARDHRRGMRFYRNQQYEAAIRAYEDSYDFFGAIRGSIDSGPLS